MDRARAIEEWEKIPGSNDGLTKCELKKFATGKGTFSEEQFDSMFDDLDVSDDGVITKAEYIYAVAKPDRETTLRALFKEFDTDGSNNLSWEELYTKCPLVQHLKNGEAQFKAADKDRCAGLSEDEFVALMNTV